MRKLGFNQFNLYIDYAAIRNDFVIIELSKGEGWLSYEDANELDNFLTDEDCKAMSTCFVGGSRAYILYQRSEYEQQLSSPKEVLQNIS